jgi:hypothetical protein
MNKALRSWRVAPVALKLGDAFHPKCGSVPKDGGARGPISSDRSRQIEVGDVNGLVNALHAVESVVMSERKRDAAQIDPCANFDRIRALDSSYATGHGQGSAIR